MNRLPPHYIELERVYARTLGQGVRSLAIAAAESGEGVSLLAGALAQRNELAGRSTLLVELHQAPEINPSIDHDAKSVSTVGTLPSCFRRSVDGHATLVGPISWEENLALRDSNHVAARIETWLESFDTIIFDTPPLNSRNGGQVPAESICAGCEGTLVVVLACRTPAASISAALDRLRAAKATLLGTVINDRHNPSLAEELTRETYRFDRWLPAIAARIRSAIKRSRLLSVEH